MKNYIQTVCLFLLTVAGSFAQQEKGIIGTTNWLNNWTEFRPSHVELNEPTQILSGNISRDTELVKRETYLLLGSVFITDGATLTIEPGTVIIGDFKTNGTLIVTKGSKIIAEGKDTDPIVFTSNRNVKKEGDWGGIFILGEAPINKLGNVSTVNYGLNASSFENISYGGSKKDSDSGILKYVRIEFAGKRTRDFGYFNALTLAGVGNKTIIENVMVSYADGNSFNIIGGEVNLEKMVSFRSRSNDYEFNFGTQSQIRNSLAVRSPYVSGSVGSRSMYVASYYNKDEVDYSKKTSVKAENLTLINLTDNLVSDIKVGLVKEAIYVAEDAALDISKSVISGYNPAVIFDKNIEINGKNLERLKFTDMYFNNCNGNIFSEHNPDNTDLENWYGNRAFFNVYAKSSDHETFIDVRNIRRPDFRLRINKIVASNDNQ